MLLLVASTAFALDGGLDASVLDGGGAPDSAADADDASVDAATDAAVDAAMDATVDAKADASDASTIKDAKSDVCNPNIEPCTVRADTGQDPDAGDVEEPETTEGCSCNSAPAAVGVSPFFLLLAGLALLRRRR